MTVRSSEFGGARPTVLTIVNAHSAGGVTPQIYTNGPSANSLKEIASGALTANTLATKLNLSGKGCLNHVAVMNKDATSRTMRLKITVDGIVIFDATSAAIANVTYAVIGIGAYSSSTVIFQPVFFKTSAVVEVASSLTETDKLSLCVNYETHQ